MGDSKADETRTALELILREPQTLEMHNHCGLGGFLWPQPPAQAAGHGPHSCLTETRWLFVLEHTLVILKS